MPAAKSASEGCMLEYAVKVSGLCQTNLRNWVPKGLVRQCATFWDATFWDGRCLYSAKRDDKCWDSVDSSCDVYHVLNYELTHVSICVTPEIV